MVNEQVGDKVIGLEVSAGKLTATALKQAMTHWLRHKDEPHGQMSVKKLMEKNETLKSIEITDKNIKDFERTARKYGVDFAVKKDSAQEPPKYIVFFKARDIDVIERAFKEYTNETLNKDKSKDPKRESVREKLKHYKEQSKHKQRERERTPKHERDASL